jgi:hypothetical protein
VATVGNSKSRGEQGDSTSLKVAVQLGHWPRALIYNNNKHLILYNLREFQNPINFSPEYNTVRLVALLKALHIHQCTSELYCSEDIQEDAVHLQ